MNVRRVLRLLGRPATGGSTAAAGDLAVEVARYKDLLRVASPMVFEQVHADAFAQLPGERREALRQAMCRDLPEEARPVSSDPEDLARAATWAQDQDWGYLVRVLRRPGAAPAAEPPAPGRPEPGGRLYAASLLGAVAAAATASPAAAETLEGFGTSVEAAQVNPSHYVPRSGSTGFTPGAGTPPGSPTL